MMYERKRLSLAGTAIAAALAFSSTPLIAQDTAASDSTTAAPAAADTSAVTTTAEPAADPLAPAADTSATATTTAKAKTATASKAKAAPVKAKSATAAKASTPVAAKTAPKPATAPVAAPVPEVATADAAPAVPLAEMVNAPKADPAPVEQHSAIDPDMVPYAAAGLGVLALAGAGIAAASRRRRRRDDEAWGEASAVQDEPVATREPSFARESAPIAAAPVAAAAAPVAVRTSNGTTYQAPAGSSPRTIAAYKGPTEENPSLSLKRRLKRARAMDQIERRNGTIASAPVPPVTAATKPVTSNRPAFSFGQPEKEPAFQY